MVRTDCFSEVRRRLTAAFIVFATLLSILASAGDAHAQGDSKTGPDGCDAGEVKFRFSHVTRARGHPKGDAVTELAALINKELNGRACMVVYPNSKLFTDNEIMPAMLQGKVEFGAPSLSKLERYTKKFRIFDLPFLFRDMDAVEWFQNSGPGARLKRSLKPKGFYALTFWNNGMRQLTASRPVLRPRDIKGLTFRVQSSEVLVRTFARVGVKSKKLSFSKLAGALKAKDVDGQINNYANILSKKLYEHQKGITEINNTVTAYIVIVPVKFWDGLPTDIRADTMQILLRVSKSANDRARETTRQARSALVAFGVPIRRLTPEQRAEWVQTLRPVWEDYADEIGRDLIEAASRANK